jgi:glycosyltransferase involved in cell wall biosynthesis
MAAPRHLASVVMPARNAVDVIGDQLAALAAQPDASDLEVLVVDNGSSDGTGAVARRWADQLPGLRVLVAAERASPGYARNVGIAAAESDSILLCDADDRVDSGWARHLLDALGSADSVAGLVVSWDGVTTPTLPARRESFAIRFEFLPAFGSNNAAFKKDIWTELGGFDESINLAEDVDLSWRIQLAGYTLAFAPEALVFGRERTTTLGQFKQTYRYGKSQVALFARHRAAGMPRTSTSDSIRSLGSLLRHVPEVAHGPSARRAWCARAGWRLGRLTGSVQQRTLNL